MQSVVTIITPTMGSPTLQLLINSLKEQRNVFINHFILWDNRRVPNHLSPEEIEESTREYPNYFLQNIVINRSGESSNKSYLRSIGLMAANTSVVLLVDDNVMLENNYISTISNSPNSWGYCKRKIWRRLLDGNYECLGIDNFEYTENSPVGINHNCIFFKRKLGVSFSCLIREAKTTTDSKVIFDFLKKYGGEPLIINEPFVNQVCDENAVDYYSQNCTQVEV